VLAAVLYAALLSPAALERGAGRLLAGVWDAGRRGEVRRALAAATRPPVPSPWDVVSREVDRWSGAWTAAYASTLRVSSLTSAPARDEARAIRACLDQRLLEL